MKAGDTIEPKGFVRIAVGEKSIRVPGGHSYAVTEGGAAFDPWHKTIRLDVAKANGKRFCAVDSTPIEPIAPEPEGDGGLIEE